jgi:choice-of-anchor B domain-containing protein
MVGMPQRDFGEGRALLLTEAGGGTWRPSETVTGEIFTVESGLRRIECADGKIKVFDCSNVEVISFMPVADLGGERGVWVNDVWGWSDPQSGREFALVSRRDGAAFVEVTDPEQPRLVGTLPRTAGSRPSVWRDIKVYRNHAFVVSDGAGAHGMQVFDLTRLLAVNGAPVVFREDAHYDRIHSAHNVAADTLTGFLYILGSNGGGETCGGGLHIVDARNPKRPSFAGCYTDRTGAQSGGYTHDAQCVTYQRPDERYRGREICVGSHESEINLADVTDKARPVRIGRSSYPNVTYAHQGWFDDAQRYFYMGDEGDEIAGRVAGTRTIVWDLARLDDPIVAREYIGPVRATDHNLFVKGDRVYQSNYGSGLRVLDISDRENPREVAFFDSSPNGRNEPGTSASASGAWSNYPFFKSGVVVFTSVREGLFIVRVKPTPLVP